MVGGDDHRALPGDVEQTLAVEPDPEADHRWHDDLGQGVDGIPAAGHARRIVPLPGHARSARSREGPGRGRGRLAPAVGPLQRRLLAIAMFEDVVAAPGGAGAGRPGGGLPDREVWRRADAMGRRVVEEPPGAGDLNGALTAARRGSPATGRRCWWWRPTCRRPRRPGWSGCWRPTPRWRWSRADGGGTNVLAWRDPASFAPSFGPRLGRPPPGRARRGAGRGPGLSLDVDTVEDLEAVAAASTCPR